MNSYCLWRSYTREGDISRQDTQFIETFRADIAIPMTPPEWLWRGQKAETHGDFRLRVASPPVVAPLVEDVVKMRSLMIKQELSQRVLLPPSETHGPGSPPSPLSLSLQALNLETAGSLRIAPAVHALCSSVWRDVC